MAILMPMMSGCLKLVLQNEITIKNYSVIDSTLTVAGVVSATSFSGDGAH